MSNFPLQNAAEQLAKQGRYGDTMMVHMNPIEVDALAKLSPTGQLTINPQTGQPEAFLPLIGSLIAPTLLGGTALGAALSPLAASAIGTGLGTVAEGGSLKEGITAGLTGAITGGLLKGFMPGTATDIPAVGDTAATTDKLLQAPEFVQATGGSGILPGTTLSDAGQEALNVLQPGTTSVPFQPVNTLADLPAARAGTEGFFSRLGQNLGFSGGATPEQLAGNPNLMTRSQAFTTQALPAAASGLVGEMYVPMDFNMPEEEDPFGDYEGPYMPQEMRTMIPGSGGNPLTSAFQGEQQLIQGNPLPIGDEFNDGGKVSNPFSSLPAMSGLGLAGNMATGSGLMGLLPMGMNMFQDDEDEELTMKEKENQRQFGAAPTMTIDRAQQMESLRNAQMAMQDMPTTLMNDGGMPLQNPEKADLNDDGEISSYERTRGKAIEENMKNMGGLIKMANGRIPAQAEIEESAETLERRRIDDAIRKQVAETMAAPMIDPRLGRMADPISTPVPKTLNEVMTPQPYQAPTLEEIRNIQSATLDKVFGNSETMNELDRNLGQFNRKYNPIVRGIEAIAPYPTKGALEIYEAIDEYRKRNN
jgi:hypothetical protein